MKYEEIEIKPVDQELVKKIKDNWDHVAKPLDGLGVFETLLCQIGAILGSTSIDIHKKAIIAMCADNGIVEEGVSQSGQEITTVVIRYMGKGCTSVGKMAACIGSDVIPVDIGINNDEILEGVLSKKVRKGTRNFAKEPAMTEAEAVKAIQTGIDMVKYCKELGYRLLGTGEMGIGNTTTSSAMAAALTGCKVDDITGRGAGLSDSGLQKKRKVIQEALDKYNLKKNETMRILCTVGGLDIAGLCGVFIGGAIYHIPIVIDGLISSVAALTAERLCPGTREYMIPSHKSKEPAAQMILNELEIAPVIDGQLALGEGTGAVMMFSLLDMALSLYQEQATFDDFEIEQYERFT